uniref:hypothetical protein n=1 Tax=Caballeronia sp. LjRoot34 TaxID=3342325 RepID=UPI003F4FDDED
MSRRRGHEAVALWLGQFRTGRPYDRAGLPRGVDHSVKACFLFSFIAVRETKTVLKYSAVECEQVFRMVFDHGQEHATRREALNLITAENGCARETPRSWVGSLGATGSDDERERRRKGS